MRHIWALVALAMLGCDPSLADDCTGPGDCPPDEWCLVKAGVCVRKDNGDAGFNGDGAATDGATGGSDGSHHDAHISPPDVGEDSAPDAENHPDSSPEDIGVDMRLPVPDGQPVDAIVSPTDATPPDSASADVGVIADATPDTGSDAAGGTGGGGGGSGGEGGNAGAGGQGGTGGTPCAPSPERCDGLDNNCDGQKDEDFGLGSDCRSGLGVCEGPGFWRCGEDGERFCDLLVPVQPTDESCNNADDDCNGSIDLVDGDPIAESCYSDSPNTMGIGQCRAGTRTCDNGRFGACVGEVIPIVEVCNGLDDDCDGDADENIIGVGVPCDTGNPGICRNGTIECQAGGLDCLGFKSPGAQLETCNGADDDCDGQIDEADPATGFGCACTPGMESPCYNGPPGSEGRGQCQAGVKVCEDALGGYSECVGQIDPTPETCNGLDDDCDGAADDGLGLGQDCFVGTGACRTEGVVECDPDGGTRCSARAENGLVETCNGLDDDCDGNIDEAENNTPLEQSCYSGPAGTQGVGLCRPGTQICVNGSFGSCLSEIGPRAEQCNGVDEDCDGTADNGFAINVPCSLGEGACLTQGEQVCSGDGLGITCNAVAGTPSDEVCDAIDNDCDGETDEGFGVYVPAGTYTNLENLQVEVAAYCIDLTEVTTQAYEACVVAGVCTPRAVTDGCNSAADRPDHPANCVSKPQAQTFCQWLNGGDLPTLNQWLKAGRGTADARTHPWGDAITTCDRAQFGACNRPGTMPVGSFPTGASTFELLDVLGNVWEWILEGGTRGGGWQSGPAALEFSRSNDAPPDTQADDIGFRCAYSAAQ